MASQLAQRFTIIDDGKSVENGLMKDLANNEEMIHQYLGASIKTQKELERQHEN
jgi:ABC-type branched-subunit amino acid transport system ATPase component